MRDLDLDLDFAVHAAEATALLLFLIELARVDLRLGVRQVDGRNLQEILLVARRVSPEQHLVHLVVAIRGAAQQRDAQRTLSVTRAVRGGAGGARERNARALVLGALTHVVTSGSHWTVSDGHSSACVMTRS